MARPGEFRVPNGLEREFLAMVLHTARQHVRSYMQATGVSETLALALTTEIVSDFFRAEATGRLILPYYWAEFVHNGRGDASARGSKFMIYFPNKQDDPRTGGKGQTPGAGNAGGLNYPQTRGSRRTITKGELQHFDKINRLRKLLDQPPIMVMALKVGPGKQAPPGKQFYVNALRIFPPMPAIEARLVEILKKIAPNGTRKLTIRLG